MAQLPLSILLFQEEIRIFTPSLIRSLLELCMVLWGIYILIWAVFPKLRNPIKILLDSFLVIPKAILLPLIRELWRSVTRRTKSSRKRKNLAYDKALSLTTLDSKTVRQPRKVTHTLDTWNAYLDGIRVAPSEYYALLSESIKARDWSDISISFIYTKQGGLFSPKRKYLRVRRGRHIMDICAAPQGNGTLVSWWLGISFPGFYGFVARLWIIGPLTVWVVGRFVKPATYFRIDTSRVFKKAIHSAVLDVQRHLGVEEGDNLGKDINRPMMRTLYD
ncbi:MAG: hypothetical protein AAF391_00175 [Bacteroidota bacterium]